MSKDPWLREMFARQASDDGDLVADFLLVPPAAGTKAFEPLQPPVIGERGKPEEGGKPVHLKVRRVNAFGLRNRSRDWQEFGNFGTHLQWKEIPEDEVWVADTVTEEELPYLVRSAEAQVWASKHGSTEGEAYEYGLAVERAERERAKEIGGERPYHSEVPPDVYEGLWLEVDNPSQIYSLMGRD